MLLLSNAFWGQSKGSSFESLDLLEAGQAAGFWRQASAGFWELDCFGAALGARLERRMHRLMSRLGSHQVQLGLLQDQQLWDATGRAADYGAELYALTDRRGRRMRLAATAEEAATSAAARHASLGGARSMWAYQIGAKWRDETRARGGLARAREFRMLDAYSFCHSLDEARAIHALCLEGFESELAALGIQAHAKQADCGEIGGLESVEILCQSQSLGDADGSLELAHLFLLGDRYSKAFGLMGKTGAAMQMGCQGLGSSRLLIALAETRRSATGFIGDEAACSHLFWVSALDYHSSEKSRSDALALAQAAGSDGILDDRELAAGRKLRDAEMGMCAYRLVASKRQAEAGMVELKAMDGSLARTLTLDEALNFIKERRIACAID
jgi:prolyl-tRNA synthetase